MFGLNRLTIKSRLLLILLFITITSVVFIGVLAYRYAQETIKERILAQLTTTRAARTYEIQTYLQTIAKQITTVSQSELTARAIIALSDTFEDLQGVSSFGLGAEEELELKAFYEDTFLPRLKTGGSSQPSVETYIPSSRAGRYLQYYYVMTNPEIVGEREAQAAPTDRSEYAATYARFDEFFRTMPAIFGFYDVFLIDPEGNVVYSVFREVDLGSNLNTGPYRGSGLAEIYQAAMNQPDAGALVINDFSFYRPSYDLPAAFMASPIYRGSRLLGVLAFQGPVDEINRIMTGGRAWREAGLGETGETFLVAGDGTLRSQARSLVEDPEIYAEVLAEVGVSESDINLIRDIGSPILLQPVSDDIVEAALEGEGAREALDVSGKQRLVSYAPLNVPGLDWAIVAAIDLAEAYAPLYTFQRILFLSTAALVLFITLLAMVIASRFIRPIDRFIDGAKAIASGEAERIEIASHDEFGRLAQSLNGMVADLNARTVSERARGDAYAAQLSSILPADVSAKLVSDETFVERHANVSVIFANLRGFGNFSDATSSEESLALLDSLISLFDEAAQEHGVEKVKTSGADYLAVCGASVARLDHARRTLEFAQALLEQVAFFNQQHALNLSLSVGLASGAVVTGVIGRSPKVYDVWGEPVDQAMDHLAKEAPAGEIWLTQTFKSQLDDTDGLEPVASALGEAWAIKPAAEVRM